MQETTNYGLPKWEKTDRILMDDFNGMTAALDAALNANADAVSAEATARADADTALGTRITNEQAARESAVSAEAAARANADAALQNAVNGKAASSHTHAQSAITGLAAALAERPCIEFSTYVGGNSKTQRVFTFSKPPKAVFILGHWTTSEKHTQCILGLFLQGAPCGTMFSLTHNSSASTNVPQSAWSGNTLTLTPPSSSGANAEAILDSPYYTYRVAAFC